MKAILILALILTASPAFALSNKDLCAAKLAPIALEIRSLALQDVRITSAEFKADLTGPQRLDGLYEVAFSNGVLAEIRLDQNCSVLEYRIK